MSISNPSVDNEKSLVERVRSVAARHGMNVHSCKHMMSGDILALICTPKYRITDRCRSASSITELENALKVNPQKLNSIIIHIEPIGDKEVRHPASPTSLKEVQDEVKKLVRNTSRVIVVTISAFPLWNELSVTFHCT